MIVEQAFFAVPEFLVGTGFVRYETEGTLVMAYAMAILQELNGRNVDNPISLINAETTYPNTARTADLHVDVTKVGTHNATLRAFGVREQSWIEAKFFRKNAGNPTLDLTRAAYVLLRDLIRLSVFPSETCGTAPKSARYLLHAYEGPHGDHLALERNAGGGRIPRGWLEKLHVAGAQKIVVGDLNGEPNTFDTEVGPTLRTINLSLDVTTFVLGGTNSPYNVYLTRIDGFSFGLQQAAVDLSLSPATFAEATPGQWRTVVTSVTNGLVK